MTASDIRSQTPRKTWHHIVMLIALTLAVVLPGLASLPVIDRDEARYVQASIQMAETGDLMNIKFQDQARNKKPAGIYWLQSAAIKTISRPDKREIWVHRLPSVLGALLAVLATYWGGIKIMSRETAFISATLLATSLLFIFEAHIAKTDAVLCGLSACIFAALIHIRTGAIKALPIWVFWLALGGSIMIKGPILLAILAFTLIGFYIWDRDLSWAKPLLRPFPILAFVVIWLPWAIAIYVVTDGAFFQDSLGQDLGGKLISTQEKHPGPPGYHLALIWIMLWPASLFLLPALAYAIKTIRLKPAQPSKAFQALKLCLLWIVPFWILIELMPTKLPHYSLPLYPAICLLIGLSLQKIISPQSFKNTQRIGLALFWLAALSILGALTYLSFTYGAKQQIYAAIIMSVVTVIACLYTSFSISRGRVQQTINGLIIAALVISFSGYKRILSKIESFDTSARIAAALGPDLSRLSRTDLASSSYTEPSLVYHLGTNIKLGSDIDIMDMEAFRNGRILLVDTLSNPNKKHLEQLQKLSKDQGVCLKISDPISGFNYSKGDAVKIHIVKNEPCS